MKQISVSDGDVTMVERLPMLFLAQTLTSQERTA